LRVLAAIKGCVTLITSHNSLGADERKIIRPELNEVLKHLLAKFDLPELRFILKELADALIPAFRIHCQKTGGSSILIV
jgi:hypothetical protein